MAAVFLACLLRPAPAAADDEYDKPPISYSQTDAVNTVSRLVDRLKSGTGRLQFHADYGYLPSLLDELQIPVSSQMLVFSKTSLQRHRISPRTPRALYFNDDVYVGYCQNGEVLEISAADPHLGAVFYTLSQEEAAVPQIVRQSDNCMICHASSQLKQVPGHLVRSVFVDHGGLPVLSAGSHRITQSSPLEDRWGGWYVTGTHGAQRHLGNLVLPGGQQQIVPHNVDNSAGMNLAALGDRFDSSAYLTGHSDIVALMVLEHQTEGHNLIARAGYATRQALHYQETLNRELGEPAGHVWDSTRTRIKNAGDALVEYLLFCGETPLTHRIEGTSGFAADFAKPGPRDSRNRSLRDFDLERRMFKHPCSYLVDSPCFQALPVEVLEHVLGRLREVLGGRDQSKPFAHLTPADRQAVLEILRETHPAWKL